MFSFATNSGPLLTSSFGTCTAIEPDHRTRSRLQYDAYVRFGTRYNQESMRMRCHRHCCLLYGINAEITDCSTQIQRHKRHPQMPMNWTRESDKYKEDALGLRSQNWRNSLIISIQYSFTINITTLAHYFPSTYRYFILHNHWSNTATSWWANNIIQWSYILAYLPNRFDVIFKRRLFGRPVGICRSLHIVARVLTTVSSICG